MISPEIISGASFKDHRGQLDFFNDFDMKSIKRFYCIEHSDTNTVRAWRGHRIEKRWFYVTAGTFKIQLIKIDDWVNPNPSLGRITFTLDSQSNHVLCIPEGYAHGLQAMEANSRLMVFADSSIEEVENDNYLFSNDYFGDWNR